MDFQQSQTHTNVENALDNELKTVGLFQLFSKKAGQEEQLYIQSIFDTIARNDSFLAERFRRILFTGDPDSQMNLAEGMQITERTSRVYRDYARIAADEGFIDLASLFNGVANIKLNHNSALQTTLINIQNGTLFCKGTPVLWICIGCGNILSGDCAPEICPICGYPQGYYGLYNNCL